MGFDGQLIHKADIERPQMGKDSYGAEKLRWPPDIPAHLEDEPCRLVVKDQRVGGDVFAERPIATTYTLLVGPGTDVQQGDRVTNITDQDDTPLPDGVGTFSISAIKVRRGRAEHHRSLTLEKIG
jgi:hypothetical protein